MKNKGAKYMAGFMGTLLLIGVSANAQQQAQQKRPLSLSIASSMK